MNKTGDRIPMSLTKNLDRRNRKTSDCFVPRNQPRFNNRTRSEGWLAPCLKSRVDNIKTWVNKLQRFARIEAISQELVRFDMQLMRNPDILGKEYQQGTLAGQTHLNFHKPNMVEFKACNIA